VFVAVGVGVIVGVWVFVAVGVGVFVRVGVAVAVDVAVAVGVCVGVFVGVCVGSPGRGVGVRVGVEVAVCVAVGDADGDGDGDAAGEGEGEGEGDGAGLGVTLAATLGEGVSPASCVAGLGDASADSTLSSSAPSTAQSPKLIPIAAATTPTAPPASIRRIRRALDATPLRVAICPGAKPSAGGPLSGWAVCSGRIAMVSLPGSAARVSIPGPIPAPQFAQNAAPSSTGAPHRGQFTRASIRADDRSGRSNASQSGRLNRRLASGPAATRTRDC
jgi:hypothetical protein